MRTKLKGINTIKRELATGEVKTYYYHRATGKALKGEPGTDEFIASIAAAQAEYRQRDIGTLAGILRDFENTVRWKTKLAESTKSEYRRVFTFWETKYGTCPHAALEDKAFRQDVLKWHGAYAEKYPREADNRVTILARVLSWAKKDGPLSVNVLDGFERAYEVDRSDMIWLPEHVEAFMAKANDEMKLGLILALHTGQRQGDLLRLAWSNFTGTHLKLRQSKTKRHVNVKCTKALRITLENLKRTSTLILTTKTGLAFKKRYFAEQWEATMKEAGIEDLHFHDLRGTTVTLLFQAGCNLGEIVAVTGHTLRRAQDILDKYLSRTSAMADNAIDKFENVLETEFAKRSAKQEGDDEAK